MRESTTDYNRNRGIKRNSYYATIPLSYNGSVTNISFDKKTHSVNDISGQALTVSAHVGNCTSFTHDQY